MSDYIKNYTVLSNVNINNLINDVKEFCKNGWEPVGGIVINKIYDTQIFYQAMVEKR